MQYIEGAVMTMTPGLLILAIGWAALARRDRKAQRRAARLEFDQVRRFIFYRG